MTGVHGVETSAMLDAYDFTGVKVLVDVGGGNGRTLAGVLQRHPALRGILFDLPHVIERARAELTAAGVAAHYAERGVLGGFVIDRVDADLADRVRALGVRASVVDTIMVDDGAAGRLARHTLDVALEGADP